jgi:hypothetical protein
MRRPLIVLLGLGVLLGYGSAFGHLRHRWHHGGYGEGSCDRWSQRYDEPAPVVTAPMPAPTPAPAVTPAVQQPVVPQIIIVQPQAAPAAPAPTVVVQPSAPAPSAPVIVQVPQAPAPATDNGKAKAQSAE